MPTYMKHPCALRPLESLIVRGPPLAEACDGRGWCYWR